MKTYLLLALGAPLLVGCAATAPSTSWGKEGWGKEGVSMEDYRLDGALCAALAAGRKPVDNGANSAGGINGKNSSTPSTPTVATGPGSGQASGAAFPTGGGGAYRESASPDMVSRAATQQRAQELAVQRARSDALKSCLVDRGYTEFRLTPEQRKHLATLPEGSDVRRAYLHKLATDPEVLKSGKTSGS
jgi:hypothetical protein